jgi:hypothetical protein
LLGEIEDGFHKDCKTETINFNNELPPITVLMGYTLQRDKTNCYFCSKNLLSRKRVIYTLFNNYNNKILFFCGSNCHDRFYIRTYAGAIPLHYQVHGINSYQLKIEFKKIFICHFTNYGSNENFTIRYKPTPPFTRSRSYDEYTELIAEYLVTFPSLVSATLTL